ncbi:MAG: nucleotide exchange factor GrpE [Planctomycetaceae bacterium]
MNQASRDGLPQDSDQATSTTHVLANVATAANMAEILKSAFPPGSSLPEPRPAEGVGDHLEEIANDMLVLMRRLRDIEGSQQTILARLDQVQEGWTQSARTIAREVDVLRRDVQGDRRHTATLDVSNELIPLIDRLRMMRANLDANADQRMIAQLEGVLESLVACLRRMGCQEFQVRPGESFDPARMECVGYVTEGVPDQVQAVMCPGYVCGQTVLRPASVQVAKPRSAADEASGGEFDE